MVSKYTCNNTLPIIFIVVVSENVKAYFRRAKAHSKVWNFDEAKRDFQKVLELDKSQINLVNKELLELDKIIKKKDYEDKLRFNKLFA